MPQSSKARESEVAQSCPTLRDPMDNSLPGSSIHGTPQARILEWVAISFSPTPIIQGLLEISCQLKSKPLNKILKPSE